MKPRFKTVSKFRIIPLGFRASYRKHLIGLIKNEHLHGVGLQESTLDHILDTTWGTDNDLWSLLESLHVITDACTANAGMALDVHEISNGNDDLLNLLSQFTGWGEDQGLALLDVGVKLLEDGNRESSGLSGTRLGLRNDIVACEKLLITIVFNCRRVRLPLMTGMMARA